LAVQAHKKQKGILSLDQRSKKKKNEEEERKRGGTWEKQGFGGVSPRERGQKAVDGEQKKNRRTYL